MAADAHPHATVTTQTPSGDGDIQPAATAQKERHPVLEVHYHPIQLLRQPLPEPPVPATTSTTASTPSSSVVSSEGSAPEDNRADFGHTSRRGAVHQPVLGQQQPDPRDPRPPPPSSPSPARFASTPNLPPQASTGNNNYSITAVYPWFDGLESPVAPASFAADFNTFFDASTREDLFSPEDLGPSISIDTSAWPYSRPQPSTIAPNTTVFGSALDAPEVVAQRAIEVTGLLQTPPATFDAHDHQYLLSPAGIRAEPDPSDDLRALLDISADHPAAANTGLQQPYFMNAMAADPNNTTDPALTGEVPDLKGPDAVDLAVGAVPHGLSDGLAHGEMSDGPSSPDGIEPFSPRRGFTHKRNEEPPRNDAGKMICRFQATCAGLTFDRRCEWSKHMDKHERPYKCTAPGCEKLQGFTYSGGLLRHQREVHKMHGGTKKALYCPEPNCKRNTGTGFTRKENLAEHIRRVHRRATDTIVAYGDGTIPNAPIARMHPDAIEQLEAATREEMELNDVTDPALTNNKRKHDELEVHENGDDEVRLLREEVKRLKGEAHDRDNLVKSLEDDIRKNNELLQQLISKTA